MKMDKTYGPRKEKIDIREERIQDIKSGRELADKHPEYFDSEKGFEKGKQGPLYDRLLENKDVAEGFAGRYLEIGAEEGSLFKIRAALEIYHELDIKPPRYYILKEKISEALKKSEQRRLEDVKVDRNKGRKPFFPYDPVKSELPRINELLEGGRSLKGLEHTLTSIIATGGIFFGLFFLSNNITGNTIGNLTNSISNWTGGILFLLGLIGFFISRKL